MKGWIIGVIVLGIVLVMLFGVGIFFLVLRQMKRMREYAILQEQEAKARYDAAFGKKPAPKIPLDQNPPTDKAEEPKA